MAMTSERADWDPVWKRVEEFPPDVRRAIWQIYFSEKDKYHGKYNHEVLEAAIVAISFTGPPQPSGMADAALEYEEAIAGADLISCATKS